MSGPKEAAAKRLSVDDWVSAGFAILAEEGQKALKIERLCSYLGVTKGSFYWHFTDISGYRDALVESWANLRDEDRRWLQAVGDIPPRERLRKMMASLVSPHHWTLERAMREWARSDSSAAASVRASDQRMLRAVRQAFLDYGFDRPEADRRAEATFAAGVGFLHLSGVRPDNRAIVRQPWFLDFMLRR